MNKMEQIHHERKEYWRGQITECDASGKGQKVWCQEHGICSTSMSTWRRRIWREEEAEKELAAVKEEQSFIEIKASADEDGNEGKGLTLTRETENRISTNQAKENRREANEPRIMKPEAIIGYREYMIGVYEDTSDQLLRRVVEVLRHA